MRRAAALLLVGILSCAVSTYGLSSSTTVVPLDGLSWGVSNANGSISLKTTLPAYPVNLLQQAGVIQDPLYRFGEVETRWVAMDTWTFTSSFTVSPELLARSNVDLVLDGVDTFATVYLNGKLLASLENFHRRYNLPAKQLLVPGVNTLRITLHPAIPIAVDRKKNHPYWIPTVTQLGNIDAYNFARKPAYDFGWDWGPGLAAAGIYGGVSLLGYDSALLQSALVTQSRLPNGDFKLHVEPELLAPAGGDAGVLSVELPAVKGASAKADVSMTSAGPAVQEPLEIIVPARAVKLWWPVGYGEQPLYDINIKYTSNSAKAAPAATADATPAGGGAAAAAAAAPTSSLTKRTGFRTVELVEKPLTQAAAELFGAAGGGWENSVKPGAGNRPCMWLQNCGQYGWVDGKKWTFVSEPLAKATSDDPVSGYDFPGAYPNSSFPGGDNPWWNQKLGVWTGWGSNALAPRIEGESMFFKVNGVPIYAKGSNIIPLHTLPVNVTPEAMADAIDLALDSRMNMLRVWGGGWYMPDQFYDLADEKGIMVWQETMFACASYPRDDKFMSEVKAEVEQQIRRISSHPSVVIWGGNNEIETSLEWYRETQNNPALFVHDYTELFIATIGGLMQKLVPDTPFVDSSPSNGVISRKPYIKRWGGAWDPRYGDVHHYDYNADCQNFKSYPMAKFVSEHGWPSFPTWPTFKAATAAEDWAVGAPGMEFRQRHYNKTLEMTNQYMKHFKVPASWQGASKEESFAKWKRYLYLNHVQQAMCIDTAFSYWRRLRSEPKGLTMGILYWQLNDVWAGASWSGIDYEGRYKPMQYRVKHQFADFVVQTTLDGDTAQVFVVSDDVVPTTADMQVSIYRLSAPEGYTCSPLAEMSLADVDEAVAPAGDAGEDGAAVDPEKAAADAAATDAAFAAAEAVAAAASGTQPTAAARIAPRFATKAGRLVSSAPAWSKSKVVDVPALNAAVVVNATIDEILSSVDGCTRTSCFLRVTATTKPTKTKPAQSSSSDLFFAQFKDLEIAAPSVTLSNFAPAGPGAVSFDVSTSEAAALLAVAETEVKGRFDDNMVNLPPCGKATLTFTAAKGVEITPEQLQAALSVATLYENQLDQVAPLPIPGAPPAAPPAAPAPAAAAVQRAPTVAEKTAAAVEANEQGALALGADLFGPAKAAAGAVLQAVGGAVKALSKGS